MVQQWQPTCLGKTSIIFHNKMFNFTFAGTFFQESKAASNPGDKEAIAYNVWAKHEAIIFIHGPCQHIVSLWDSNIIKNQAITIIIEAKF